MNTLAKFFLSAALVAGPALATDFTFVPIPGNNNIQTSLINTFPTGIFSANNSLGTPFSIGARARKLRNISERALQSL